MSIKSWCQLFFFVVICASISACYYDVAEELYPSGPVCDTIDVKYSTVVMPILQQQCYSCHDNNATLSNVKLEGYQNVKTHVDNGKLLGAITHANGYSPMPKNLPKLSDCNIAKINAWIKSGAINN